MASSKQDRGPRGIGLRHFQHDLVVRRRDRAALDPRLKKAASIVASASMKASAQAPWIGKLRHWV